MADFMTHRRKRQLQFQQEEPNFHFLAPQITETPSRKSLALLATPGTERGFRTLTVRARKSFSIAINRKKIIIPPTWKLNYGIIE